MELNSGLSIIIIFLFGLILYNLLKKEKGSERPPNTEDDTETDPGKKPKVEKFTDIKYYSPLYVSPNYDENGSYLYTQSMGDTDAMKHGNVGQGTSGTFLPLQGNGAQVFLINTSNDNYTLPSVNNRRIGGGPDYTERSDSGFLKGFNDFGYFPKEGMETNSYLLQGANERVNNPGQMDKNLPCADWWPDIEGHSCLSGSDFAGCVENSCKKFVKNSKKTQYQKLKDKENM